MKNNVKKTDAPVKTDVLAELKYEPRVKVPNTGALVNDGAVTLDGFVTSMVLGLCGVTTNRLPSTRSESGTSLLNPA